MNVNFENDRQHCALQIRWKDFAAWLLRHGGSLKGGQIINRQFQKFGILVCSNHLWVPCLIHRNTFLEICRHTHTKLQHVSPNIKTKRVCDILPAVRALTVNLLSAFCRPFHCWQRCHGDENCLQLFVIILRDQVFSRRAQFFIMIVDVGKRLFQLKSMYCNSFHGIYLRKNHSDIPSHAGPPLIHHQTVATETSILTLSCSRWFIVFW